MEEKAGQGRKVHELRYKKKRGFESRSQPAFFFIFSAKELISDRQFLDSTSLSRIYKENSEMKVTTQ
jgi:hypothetical protein